MILLLVLNFYVCTKSESNSVISYSTFGEMDQAKKLIDEAMDMNPVSPGIKLISLKARLTTYMKVLLDYKKLDSEAVEKAWLLSKSNRIGCEEKISQKAGNSISEFSDRFHQQSC